MNDKQITENSLAKALIEGRCPRCRQGKMFQLPVYRVDKIGKMNKNCHYCGASFDPEPGFYFGAMYISYAFSVATVIITFVVLYNFLGDPPIWVYVLTVTAAILLILPFSFRYSRILYLHAFGGMKYNKKLVKESR